LADATSRALLKLRAAGIAVDADDRTGFEPRVEATEPAFEPLLAATRDGASVTFDYRTGSGAAPTRRHLDPWSVVSWHGRWYVVGHDRDRDAVRVFRLSRVAGQVRRAGPARVPAPDDLDPRRVVAQVEPPSRPQATARLRVRSGTAASLRRLAGPDARRGGEGWDVVEVPYADLERTAEWLAGYGRDVVVVAPDDLREAVVGRLRAVAERYAEVGA
jgi:proteasome accessory factor B